jgi:ribosomal protein S18 acetylase RimI-like enzyme
LIRKATRLDIPRIMEIRAGVRENKLRDPSRVTIEDVCWFVDNPGIFVWEADGKIVGFSAADPRNGNIFALFVEEDYEGRGIGQALFERACAVLVEARSSHMRLTTWPGTRAEQFYRRAGWRVVGTEDGNPVFERETESVIIRSATAADRMDLRQAIIEPQDCERLLHTTRLPGEQVADAYLDWMLGRAESCGAVLVADSNSIFAGFVAGWIEQSENIGETPDSNRVGYISDVCVMPVFRGRRIAIRLLKEIERHLAGFGVARIRINSLAGNKFARVSYQRAGFAPYEIIYEKTLGVWATRIVIRPAHGEDFDYCAHLYFEGMENIIKELNLDVAAHAAGFRQRWDVTQVRIVTLDGTDIGWLQSLVKDDALFLGQLFVDKSLRGRGIGTELVKGLIGEAASAGRAVTLGVVKTNPALRLYERLGFRTTHEDERKFYMRREPPS